MLKDYSKKLNKYSKILGYEELLFESNEGEPNFKAKITQENLADFLLYIHFWIMQELPALKQIEPIKVGELLSRVNNL